MKLVEGVMKRIGSVWDYGNLLDEEYYNEEGEYNKEYDYEVFFGK